jgi:hypothetical protein
MNFAPWWRDEFLRRRIVGLAWALIFGPVIAVVVLWFLDRARLREISQAVPAFLVMTAVGILLLLVERHLRPRHHHAQVLYVELPDVKPYHYSICECRWFGGVTDDVATAFRDARKHTDQVDEEVVRVFDDAKHHP